MKIIQTYWTKPMFHTSEELYNRIKGGWPAMHYALSAMAYSCLSIKKYYPDIELVTDSFGMELLIDVLDLPYKNVNLALDKFDVNLNLWALAKVYSYSLQEEPFTLTMIYLYGKGFTKESNSLNCVVKIQKH